jgi:hypothetical protein
MAAGIIKALFGIGKSQMKTIPWTKMTPELHNQLSSQLGKLMFVVKSQNLKLTKFQQDYLMNQLKHMEEFEKRVLTKTETPKPKGEVRPFMGFTPEVIPGGKKLVPSRTGKKKPINVNYTEAEKKLGFPIGEVKYLEDLVDIEKMGMKNYYNLVMDRADEIRKRMRVTDEGGTKIPYREFETLQKELNEIDALMTRVRKEVPADKRPFLKFDDEVTKPDPEDLASGGIAGPLHLYDGGRANYDKGGMSRRGFLKMLGGLGALPIVGKYFKLAKPAATIASKTPMVAQSPEYLGTLIEVLRAKGIEKITKLGDKITEYKGVVLEEQPGRIEVYRKGKKKEGYHEVLEGTEEVKDEGLETAKIIQGEDEYFGKVSKKGDEDLIEIADEIKGMVSDADEWTQPVRFKKSINPRLQAQHDYWANVDKKAKKDNFASGGLVDLLSL